MTKIKGSLKTISFIYDFAIDGGAKGDHPMGVFLPIGCLVMGSFIQSKTDLTSGGAAVVDINTLAGATILSNTQSGTQKDFTDYNSGTYGFIDSSTSSPQMNAVGSNGGLILPPGLSSEVCVTIEPAAALTGGSFKCLILYTEF